MQSTCQGYASCNPKPAEKQRNPDSLQAKLHLLVFHHQVTDIPDRQVAKELDVVPSDLVKQLGICISARQNEAGQDEHRRQPTLSLILCTTLPQLFPELLLAISCTAQAFSPQVRIRLCNELILQIFCNKHVKYRTVSPAWRSIF